MRLGGWSHIAGTYGPCLMHGFCKAMFGYELPKKIGNFFMKKFHYASGKGLATVGPVIDKYHDERLAR